MRMMQVTQYISVCACCAKDLSRSTSGVGLLSTLDLSLSPQEVAIAGTGSGGVPPGLGRAAGAAGRVGTGS